MNRLRLLAWHLYRSVRGGGADFLLHKREYHRRRVAAERRVVQRANKQPDLLQPTVCPACGKAAAAGTARFRNPVGFQFSVCPSDGTVYMDPLPAASCLVELNNDPAETYHWQADEPDAVERVEPKDQEDFEAILRWIAPLSERPRLLDIGCAVGGFLKTASQRFDVEGVELNDITASIARANGFRVTTGEVAAVDGPFDLVTMLQVIEHIPRPADALHEIRRVLAPGGRLYLNTPNVDSASFSYLRERHIHVSSGGHVSLFTKAGLEALAQRCGYEVVAHEYCGGRDLQFHDLLTLKTSPERFSHRMALYRPRLWHATRLVELSTFGLLDAWLYPKGHLSYQRALLRVVDQETEPHRSEARANP